MDDPLTQCTQDVVDPRRMGMNNSGLSADDVADVMCILHPASPAAFRLVAETARRAPQHILQNVGTSRYDSSLTPSMLQEQETFMHDNEDANNQPLDLALRFSSRTVQPHVGFVFGRNMELCDIAVNAESHKRVSNVHFAIYANESGVVMLRDMSTNGTMVDETLLKGKSPTHEKTRMITHGSVIAILSYHSDETLKFIVRLPSRDGFVLQYEDRFREYFARKIEAERRLLRAGKDFLSPRVANGLSRQQNASVKAPMIQNQYGMHWGGGEKYNVVGQIGKGAFASVYQLATKIDGQLYAAKELEKRKFIKNGVLDRKLENEMLIMQSINHPSIVQYFEHVDVANHLYIIMEFVACGDLQQHLTEYGALRESMAKQMALQVFDALEYLHGKSITHRDIKPDNILIACLEPDNFQIKLSDFGLSKVVKDSDTFLKTFCGTLLYCAPEVFPHYDAHIAGKGTKRPRKQTPPTKTFHSYSQAVDIWSFGAVLWYSLCHKPPFEGVADNTGRGMFDKIMMTPLDAADLDMQGVTEEAVALLVEMLNTDPAARPSAHQCLQHEWFGDQRRSSLSAPRLPLLPSRPSNGLGAIAEVNSAAELGASQEPDVGALNSRYSEVSLNDSDMNFLDPRQSKRFKSSHMEYRGQQDAALESSEEKYAHIPIILEDPEESDHPPAVAPRSQKLFGEISQSDIAALTRPENNPMSDGASLLSSDDPQASQGSHREEHIDHSHEVGASPSLLGAESMVRDLNMDSNSSNGIGGSNAGSRSEPTSPKTPASVNDHDEQPSANTVVPAKFSQQTPKSAKAPFSRQIKLQTPPSFYWKADDPSTHTLEYASKASGYDFTSGRVANEIDESGNPVTQDNTKDQDELARIHAMYPHSQPNYMPPRYGRLVSLPGSFADISIDLQDVYTSWGRASDNTVVFPDKSETRIPKLAFHIFFHVPGLQGLPEGEDFTNLPGLYCGINTHASAGLHVNGVHLQKSPEGKLMYGRLHTGDEVEVWQAGRGGKAGLTFRVELSCGEGKDPRSDKGPRFKIVKRSVGEEAGKEE
jgi:serine/threonine protein kinase